jgi:predicted nucleic acid-binding protein
MSPERRVKVFKSRPNQAVQIPRQFEFGVEEAIIVALEVFRFEATADVNYGLLRARLEPGGKAICGNDLLIGAPAPLGLHHRHR